MAGKKVMDLCDPEIIKRHGYPVETYSVTTEDGYILTVFRIPYGQNSVDQKPGPPVFLQHGIALNCACFVDTGNKSLGFILADEGYDVWLGNFRGNSYSRNHTRLDTSSKDYWDYSFNEHGRYDVPAQIDLVYSTTGQKITYIGFSMGTTSAYIYGVTYPDLAAEKLKIVISMAPIAFLKEIRTVVRFLLPLWGFIEPILEAATNGELMLRQPSITRALCLPYPFQMKVCQFALMIVFGFDYEQDDPETLPITILQNIDATSVKTVSHYIQLIQSGKFQNYDYGINNLRKYGTAVTPQYNLSKLKVPIYLMRGPNDLLGTKENVEKLHASLPKRANPFEIFVVDYDRFSHSDFLNARDVVPLLYNYIVIFLQNQFL